MNELFHKYKILIDRSNPKDVLENIEKYKNNKESFYIFNQGKKADFLYSQSPINNFSFNYFQIYDKNIFDAFQKIKEMFNVLSGEYQISKERNRYYLASELENNFFENGLYDVGGMKIPVFAGYWFLKCQENAKIIFDEISFDIYEGSTILFDASKKYSFKNVSSAISFNISTLSKIQNQYPQKWIPM
jgi:hypothetical protein